MSKNIKILVVENNVEDNVLIQHVFSTIKGIKCDLIFAERFTKAIELLECNAIDLVLLDLAVLDSYGIKAFEEIYGIYSEIPIIMLGSPDEEEMAIDAVRKGAQDYLIKSRLGSYPLRHIINCSVERNLLRIKMAQASITDELTKLYNRRGFFVMTGQQLQLARRMQKNVGVFFIDIDGMKEINDFFGHHQGDQALIDISKILKDACRSTDIVGRIGGDEFGISLIQEVNSIQLIEKRIRNRIELHNKARLRKYRLSICIGEYCVNTQSCIDIQKALAEADKMMYLEKSQKKILQLHEGVWLRKGASGLQPLT